MAEARSKSEDGAGGNIGTGPGVTSEDIHGALFGARTPKKRTLDELKEGIRRYVRKRCARG